MEMKLARSGFLSGNALKLIAAVSMVIDHIGMLFFPGVMWPRIIGRVSFPIFAFMIAEGCKYTRSRVRYFLTVFVLAVLCQSVYWFFAGSSYMSVLVTFSLAILMIYALQFLRESWGQPCGWGKRLLSALLFPAIIGAVWYLNQILTISYGFWGCMAPLFAAAFQKRRGAAPDRLDRLDKTPVHGAMLSISLLLLVGQLGRVQMYGLLAVPLLLCYSGRRGKWNLKYFFYIFYPLHLVVLEGIWMLMEMIK